jgi:hypothetical protein
VKESERWRKLAEAVHNGDWFVSASIELVNNDEFERAPLGGRKGNALIYGKPAQKADVLYALLLAEEAEEDEAEYDVVEEMVERLKKDIVTVPRSQPLVVIDTMTGGGMFPTTVHHIPLPASICWTDPEPFPEEKEELKPVYIPGYMERRTTWTEKWTTFRESVREWVRRTF